MERQFLEIIKTCIESEMLNFNIEKDEKANTTISLFGEASLGNSKRIPSDADSKKLIRYIMCLTDSDIIKDGNSRSGIIRLSVDDNPYVINVDATLYENGAESCFGTIRPETPNFEVVYKDGYLHVSRDGHNLKTEKIVTKNIKEALIEALKIFGDEPSELETVQNENDDDVVK